MVAAAVALVAVVVLAVVGLDRRDAATLGVALLMEDCLMLGNLAVVAVLVVAIVIVWWRGRIERRRVAEAFERARRAEAQAAADAAIEDARRRAERDARRPAGDVLTDFARRGR